MGQEGKESNRQLLHIDAHFRDPEINIQYKAHQKILTVVELIAGILLTDGG